MTPGLGPSQAEREPWSSPLEQRVQREPQNPRLTALLQRLQLEDRLFDYNVPASIRTASDEVLLDFLGKTYAQPLFVIVDSAEVAKYASVGDKVVKVGLAKKLDWELNPGDRGFVKKVNSASLVIKFYNGVQREFHLDQWTELTVYGTTRFFDLNPPGSVPLPDGEFGVKLIEKTATEYRDQNWPIKKKYLVRYTGQPLHGPGTIIPNGAEGIIFARRGGEYAIAWAQQPELQQRFIEHHCDGYHAGYTPELCHPAQDFKLVIPNTINYPKLHDEAWRGNES